ncbi:MAG TPA: ACP phosphodiesterase [Rhodanobacteraceae bacterium]|jgi:acyl carrier protein phosphodiesterase|nr:ACP phosphodiesterase [Rhodanobacteraceae bacterium]
MNHLAHALLADAGGDEFALGSAMGDFVHGHPDARWPPARQAGLRFHRAIDGFTDRHPHVVAARRLFAPPFRRYAGILLDVWFDHLLVLGWNRLVPAESLDAFSERWLALLERHAGDLPASLGGFIRWMHAHDLPVGYGDEATLDEVFRALARRLSRPSPVGDALPVLRAQSNALQPLFEAFFPDLLAYGRELRRNPSE